MLRTERRIPLARVREKVEVHADQPTIYRLEDVVQSRLAAVRVELKYADPDAVHADQDPTASAEVKCDNVTLGLSNDVRRRTVNLLARATLAGLVLDASRGELACYARKSTQKAPEALLVELAYFEPDMIVLLNEDPAPVIDRGLWPVELPRSRVQVDSSVTLN